MTEQMTYMAKFGVDASEFTGGLQQMASGFMATFGPAGIVVGAAAGVSLAMGKMVLEQGEIADANLDMAETTGIAVEAIQRFHYAAKLSGDSISTVDSMLNKLTLSLGEAQNATSAQAKAFNDLGISTEGKTTEEVFLELSAALTGMENKQKAAALSMDILGKSYKDMLPYMSDYLKNQKEINNLDTFSEEQEAQLKKGKEAYDKIGASISFAAGQAALLAINSYDAFDQFVQTAEGGGGAMNRLDAARRASGYQGADRGKGLSDAMEADKAAKNFVALADPFANMSISAIELHLAQERVTSTQDAMNVALTTGKGDVEALSIAYHSALNDFDKLTKAAAGAAAALEALKPVGATDAKGKGNTFIGYDSAGNPMYSENPYYDAGSVDNQAQNLRDSVAANGGNMSPEQLATFYSYGKGVNYGPGANTWDPENYAAYKSILAFANQDTTGNPFMNDIKTLETQRYNPMNGQEYNPSYSYGSGKETFVGTAQRLMEEYNASKTATVNITISPDFSESAQSIADKTAEAISRELARQAAL